MLEPQAHHGRGAELAEHVQRNLMRVNEEYCSKCGSGRLLPIQVREVPDGTWDAMRREHTSERGNFEEYKHPCLVGDFRFVDRISALDCRSPQRISGRMIRLHGMQGSSARALPAIRLRTVVPNTKEYVGRLTSWRARRYWSLVQPGWWAAMWPAARRRPGTKFRPWCGPTRDRRLLDGVPVRYVEADLARPERFAGAGRGRRHRSRGGSRRRLGARRAATGRSTSLRLSR